MFIQVLEQTFLGEKGDAGCQQKDAKEYYKLKRLERGPMRLVGVVDLHLHVEVVICAGPPPGLPAGAGARGASLPQRSLPHSPST